MTAVIDAFLDAGVNYICPCKFQADMDIRSKLEYKMRDSLLGDGTVFSIDHVPDGIWIANYR